MSTVKESPFRNKAWKQNIGPNKRSALPPETWTGQSRSSKMIYFVALPTGDIKIGKTDAASKTDRIAAWEKEAARQRGRIRVLAVIHGERAEEERLHSYFKAHRIPNLSKDGEVVGYQSEIFHPVPELLRYIRWLRDQNFVEVEEEFGGNRPKDVEIADFAGWGPTPERQKEPPSSGPLFGSADETRFDKRELTGDDYYTPPNWIELVREFYGGGIDLDPASHAVANRVVKARRIYTKKENGLLQPWTGRVWLNPPFDIYDLFVEKILVELDSPLLEELITLAPITNLSAQYFQPLLQCMSGMTVPRGRGDFWGPLATSTPSTGHVLIYFGDRASAFCDHFSVLGRSYVGAS